MYKNEDINSIVSLFLASIQDEFPVIACYLFGSYADGTASEYSDIDLAVISNKFEGRRFLDREKLAKYVIRASVDLEIHPFTPEDFTEDNPFVKEILTKGRKILAA